MSLSLLNTKFFVVRQSQAEFNVTDSASHGPLFRRRSRLGDARGCHSHLSRPVRKRRCLRCGPSTFQAKHTSKVNGRQECSAGSGMVWCAWSYRDRESQSSMLGGSSEVTDSARYLPVLAPASRDFAGDKNCANTITSLDPVSLTMNQPSPFADLLKQTAAGRSSCPITCIAASYLRWSSARCDKAWSRLQ